MKNGLEKLSFFKLPFVLALSYVFFSLMIFLYQIGYSYHIEFITKNHFTYFVFIKSVIILPYFLFILAISAITFYKINIHNFSQFNIILVCLIGLLISIVHYFINFDIRWIIFETDYNIWVGLFFRIVQECIIYCIIGLLTYYLLKNMKNIFNKNYQPFRIDSQNSTKIHRGLFIIFFFAIMIQLYFFMIPKDTHYLQSDISLVFYIVVILYITISTPIPILMLKNRFTKTSNQLQAKLIIKLAFLANFLLLIISLCFSPMFFDILVKAIFGKQSYWLLLLLVLMIQSFLWGVTLKILTGKKWIGESNLNNN